MVLSGLMACQQSKKKEAPPSFEDENAEILSKPLDLEGAPQTTLSREAKSITSDWVEYLSLKSKIENFEDYTLQDLVENNEDLLNSAEELQDSLPEEFQTRSIKTRITVLVTKAHILHQNSKKEKYEARPLQESGRKIYETFSNLKIQLNEAFLSHSNHFENQFDRIQDSIQRSKRGDSIRNGIEDTKRLNDSTP